VKKTFKNNMVFNDWDEGSRLMRQPATLPFPCFIPNKTFIYLPFVGGISAFAVILPRPQERL